MPKLGKNVPSDTFYLSSSDCMKKKVFPKRKGAFQQYVDTKKVSEAEK